MLCLSMVLLMIVGSFLLAACQSDRALNDSLYQNRCNKSLECAIYPELNQGPDVIWLPFFCNEESICGCPNGWIPDFENNICLSRVSDSRFCSCEENIWAISLLVLTFLAIFVYGFISLFSQRYAR